MRYSRAFIEGIGYELAPNVVTSAALERRLEPTYRALRFQPGQLEALTGIRERRYWDEGQTMAEGSVRAARKALEACGLPADRVDLVIYGGVCRDQVEPATACAVAAGLGVPATAHVYDVSNACLGVINGIVHAANAIELGQARAAVVVGCESARKIVDLTIDKLNGHPTMESFRLSLATLTGGSGAIGVAVVDQSLSSGGHRILGGIARTAPSHHQLCRWWPDTGVWSDEPQDARTDAGGILSHGVALGVETWNAFRDEMNWRNGEPDRIICHQVGSTHRSSVLNAIGVPAERDFATFPFLGNIGTVSLPITAAIAEERGFLQPGHRVGFLGIGSGLNCLMLGVNW